MSIYNSKSPYYRARVNGDHLDVVTIPTVKKDYQDVLFQVNKTYEYRPDLLAHDLYGDANLWWVFAARNPNVIEDPVWDMRVGVTIYLPKGENLVGIGE